MFRSSPKSRLYLAAALGLALAAGAGWWWHRTTRPEYRLERGREAIRRGDWETVYAAVGELEAGGQSDRALLLSAESLAHKGDVAAALRALGHIEDRGGIGAQAALLSARCLLELKRLREAHHAYSSLLERDPSNADVHRGLGAVAYDLGQLDQAITHLERAGGLDGADGRPHRLIGLISKDLSRYPEAEAAYRESLARRLPPAERLAVRRELADVLVRRHRYAEALAVLDAIEEVPRPDDIAVRAEALEGLGRKDEARRLLDPALDAHPDDATLQRSRGRLYLQDGEPRKAVECLERAVRLVPRDDVARYQLGLAYAAAGRAADAAEQQRRVQALRSELQRLTDLTNEAMNRPWDAKVRRDLASLCRQRGDPQLAAMWDEAAKACEGK